jgi:hypothetical protein
LKESSSNNNNKPAAIGEFESIAPKFNETRQDKGIEKERRRTSLSGYLWTRNEKQHQEQDERQRRLSTMAHYNPRRGPNVSQYLRELNTIPRADAHLGENTFSIENDLALFTNTQFFDLDAGQNADFQAEAIKPGEADVHSAAVSEVAGPTAIMSGGDMHGMDFMHGELV